jgi:hypothetical protein
MHIYAQDIVGDVSLPIKFGYDNFNATNGFYLDAGEDTTYFDTHLKLNDGTANKWLKLDANKGVTYSDIDTTDIQHLQTFVENNTPAPNLRNYVTLNTNQDITGRKTFLYSPRTWNVNFDVVTSSGSEVGTVYKYQTTELGRVSTSLLSAGLQNLTISSPYRVILDSPELQIKGIGENTSDSVLFYNQGIVTKGLLPESEMIYPGAGIAVSTGTAWGTSITDNSVNWNTAYGWGDHSTEGYLKSYTETDPVFSAHAASGITSTNITNWNSAYGWGDHSTQGYITSESQSLSDVLGVGATTNSQTILFDYDNNTVAEVKLGTKSFQFGEVFSSSDLSVSYGTYGGSMTEMFKWRDDGITEVTKLKIGYSSLAEAGALRYTSGSFQGYNGSTWIDFGGGSGASTFLGLSDTPGSYSGMSGKWLRVNAGSTALEFTDAPSGGGVTSIGITSTDLSVSGSPITTSGNISLQIATGAVQSYMLNNNIISGKTALTSGLVSTDELLVSDAGIVKRMDVSVLQTYMQNNLTFGGDGGGVTSVAAGNGMNFTTITSTGSVTMGTPSSITTSSTNGVTSTSHTHTLDLSGRSVSTQYSLTGGGNLGSNRTLSLVGDLASPGNSKYYGTNSSGTRGFYDLPSGGSSLWTDAGTVTYLTSTTDKVSIGKSSNTGEMLEVNGNVKASNFILSSERKLKTNIENINDLSRFDNIPIYQFNFKKDIDRTRYGVIVDEVEKVAPELIYGNESKTVAYIDLLIAKIARLEQRVSELEERFK